LAEDATVTTIFMRRRGVAADATTTTTTMVIVLEPLSRVPLARGDSVGSAAGVRG
jgi:hypothetical protein